MLPEDLRGHLVTGGPVVNIGKKAPGLSDAEPEVFHPGNEEGVQLVFIEIPVRKL